MTEAATGSGPTNQPGDADAPIDAMEQLDRMTREEVDDLPYGFIVLDRDGTILLYNRYEERMSHLPADRVLGKSFFRDIAPCTRVEAFLGRFQALADAPPGHTDRFAFRFHFLHGAQDVLVHFCRAPAERVFMTVHRRPIAHGEDWDRLTTLHHEPDRGRLTGPLGTSLPLGEEQTAAVLLRLGAAGARELGRSLGRGVARAAAAAGHRAGEPRLEQAPRLLAIGLVDEALSRCGLGRIAVDLTQAPERLLCFVRPSLDAALLEFASLYEGILETALSASLGVPYAARCVEGRALESRPWRLALVRTSEAEALEPEGGEQPDDVLRRLGLAIAPPG